MKGNGRWVDDESPRLHTREDHAYRHINGEVIPSADLAKIIGRILVNQEDQIK